MWIEISRLDSYLGLYLKTWFQFGLNLKIWFICGSKLDIGNTNGAVFED